MNYLKKAPLKVIWTFHCEFMFTGKCAITYDCNKWQTECHKCPQVKEYPKSLVFDFSNPMFKQKKELFKDFNNLTIVTPPKWLEAKVKLSFLRDKPVAVIPNGIDQNIFKPTDYKDLSIYPLIKDKKLILSVAADIMSENKGGHRILEIASYLVDKKEIIFVLVGTKKPENVNLSNVIFLERTKSQKELAKLYTAAHAYLIVSKSENYPSTCLEALSCGTPIVGYDVGGISDTINKGFGDLVAYNNKLDLTRVIMKLVNSNKPTNEILKTYHPYHSKTRMHKEYLNIYNSNDIIGELQ
jgi:glycosyltransferase involved in cell wall biosynthesis